MVSNVHYWQEHEGKESYQKLVITLIIHHEDSTVVITLLFQIIDGHISIHEINWKIVWPNCLPHPLTGAKFWRITHAISKSLSEFPMQFSILIKNDLIQKLLSLAKFSMQRILRIISEWYERFWNSGMVITFVIT